MARQAAPTPKSKEVPIQEAVVRSDFALVAHLGAKEQQTLMATAEGLGYEGALSVGVLEDEIRFYQRRTVEAVLEVGKRLILLKQMTPHGEFAQRVELLGFAERTAQRFMQAAQKTGKSAKLAGLSTQVKNASAFLELVTHDDDVLDNLAAMDDFDRMSPTQLRAAVRELQAEKIAAEKVAEKKDKKLRQLEHRIERQEPDEALADLVKEAAGIANETVGLIRGSLRQALIAVSHQGDEDHSVLMAGLVGQVQADLNRLREEFNLPDVSNAADAALASEVAQWAGDAKKK